MYRRYMQTRSCCSCNNSCKEDNQDLLDDTCEYVQNTMDVSDLCECGFDEEYNVFPENPMLGQSYVPMQYMDQTFKPCVGLKMGTIFPELVSPYTPCQSMREIDYIRATNTIKEGCNKCQ